MGEQDERISLLGRLLAARARHGAVQRVLRRADATPTTCAAGSRTRAIFNPANGSFPRAEHPAGLLARSRPGPAGWPGRSSVSPNSSSSWRPSTTARAGAGGRARRRSPDGCSTPPGRPADFYVDHARDRWRPVLGHGRARPGRPRRLGTAAGGSRTTTTSRWTAPPPPSRRRACFGWATTCDAWPEAASRTCRPGSDPATLFDPGRRPTSPRTRPPGPAAALGLPPAERLGPRARRPERPAWRIESVGRLPRCARPHLSAAGGQRRAVPDVLRPRVRTPCRVTSPGSQSVPVSPSYRRHPWHRPRRWPTRSPAKAGRLHSGPREPSMPPRRCERARAGADVVYVRSDVSVDRRPGALLEAVTERLGGIDALVNNAGRAPRVRADLLEPAKTVSKSSSGQPARAVFPHAARRAAPRQPRAPAARDAARDCRVRDLRVRRARLNNSGEYCVSKAGLAMAVRNCSRLASRPTGCGLRGQAGHRGDGDDGRVSTSTMNASPAGWCPRAGGGSPPTSALRGRTFAWRRSVRDRPGHARRRRPLHTEALRKGLGARALTRLSPKP